jgi:hypothetical protein
MKKVVLSLLKSRGHLGRQACRCLLCKTKTRSINFNKKLIKDILNIFNNSIFLNQVPDILTRSTSRERQAQVGVRQRDQIWPFFAILGRNESLIYRNKGQVFTLIFFQTVIIFSNKLLKNYTFQENYGCRKFQ